MDYGKMLLGFAIESNNIEGIYNERAHLNHAAALKKFLEPERIKIDHLVEFVTSIQPDAHLRLTDYHRVFIGGHAAPKGSLNLQRLAQIVSGANDNFKTPNVIHQAYEHAHPFTDGNGRSGRALWLWQMIAHHNYDGYYKFLQMYYYMTLSESYRG